MRSGRNAIILPFLLCLMLAWTARAETPDHDEPDDTPIATNPGSGDKASLPMERRPALPAKTVDVSPTPRVSDSSLVFELFPSLRRWIGVGKSAPGAIATVTPAPLSITGKPPERDPLSGLNPLATAAPGDKSVPQLGSPGERPAGTGTETGAGAASGSSASGSGGAGAPSAPAASGGPARAVGPNGAPGAGAKGQAPLPEGFTPTPAIPRPIFFDPLPPGWGATPALEPEKPMRPVFPPSGRHRDHSPFPGMAPNVFPDEYSEGPERGRPRPGRIDDSGYVGDNREHPGDVMIPDEGTPMLDQRDSNRCLQFASRSIVDSLTRRARKDGKGIEPNEWDMLRFARGSDGSFNEFTDQADHFWNVVHGSDPKMPPLQHDVLFSCGYDRDGLWNPWGRGGMSEEQLDDMKYALKTYRSPILFVYKPDDVRWWHANVCIGYNDRERVLICRDSAFGTGDGTYRDLYRLPYDLALHSGKHASVYYLPQDAPPEKDRVRQTRCLPPK